MMLHTHKILNIITLATALVFSSAILLAPQVVHADIISNLMFHWALDEGSGTNAADSSGNGNNGTSESYPNHISWGAGHIGTGAALFDTNDQRINVEDVGTADILTLSAWIYPNNAGNNDLGRIIQRANTHAFTLCDGVAACASGSNALVFAYIAWDTPGSWYTEADVITMNAWNHVVVTYDRTSTANDPVIYVNGSPVAVYEYSTPTGSSYAIPYFIGIGDWGDYFSGRIDEVRYYHRILSAGDVAELYAYTGEAAPPVTFSRPPNNLGLVGYWSFDDGTGTVATDFSGNGNHGSQDFGTVTWIPGKRSNALDFGSAQFSTAYQDRASTSTYSIWIYPQTGGDDLGWIVRQPTGNGIAVCKGNAACGSLANTIFFLNTRTGTNGEWHTDANSIRLDEWNHVAITYDESIVTNDPVIYINGVSVTVNNPVTPAGSFYSPGQLFFGSSSGSANYNGMMDELRIYGRVLNATEIAARLGASSVDLHQGSSLAEGLVGHWTFDGTDTLATITDRSGEGNHGYFNGGATSSAKTIGVLGQALIFDGADDFVDFNSPSLASASFSIAGWVYRDVAAEFNHSWLSIGSAAGNDTALHLRTTQSDEMVFDFYNNGLTSDTGIFLEGQWNHVVYTYDVVAGSRTMYRNGVSVANETSGVAPYTGDTSGHIGKWISSEEWQGKIDDVRIYDRALTATEAKQLYNLGQVKIQP